MTADVSHVLPGVIPWHRMFLVTMIVAKLVKKSTLL
jgi:hypothetical protein